MKVAAFAASAIAVVGALGTAGAAQAHVPATPEVASGASIRNVSGPKIAGYYQTDSRFQDAYDFVRAEWRLPLVPLGGVRSGAEAADWVDLNSGAGKEVIGAGSLERVVGAPEHRSVRYSLFFTRIPGPGIVTLPIPGPDAITLRHGDEIEAGIDRVSRDSWSIALTINTGPVGSHHVEEIVSRTVRFTLPALNESCEALESRIQKSSVLVPLARTSAVQFRDAECFGSASRDLIPLTQPAQRATVFHATMVSNGQVLVRVSSPPVVGPEGSEFTVTDAFGD
jgi:hypothetical protein